MQEEAAELRRLLEVAREEAAELRRLADQIRGTLQDYEQRLEEGQSPHRRSPDAPE